MYLLTALLRMDGSIFRGVNSRWLANIKQKGHIMKVFPLSTNNASFVERLKQLAAALYHFLDWFTPTHPFIAEKRARTFLVSFTILFFELFCIRWIPSYVRYLSYFNNFLLLASFLGIGLGMLSARRERFWFPPFPVLLALLVVVIAKTKFELIINSTQVLYFGLADEQSAQAENFLVLPLIFGIVTLCFIPLARSFGQLFSQLPPLTAYTYDIIGSLAGIAAFSAMAYFSLPPLVWFSILGTLLLLLTAKRTVLLVAIVLAATLIEVGRLQVGAYWSPYYKIRLIPAIPKGYIVDVNGSSHQAMGPSQNREPFYKEAYRIFGSRSF